MKLLSIATLFCLLSVGACSPEEPEEAAGPPPVRARNLLLISVDTLRADHVGAYGGRAEASPAIDALAAEGALFEDVYAPMGMTLACMTSLFTSKYPNETGVIHNMKRLSLDEITLAERLGDAGFRSRGMTANGVLQPEKSAIDQGFDEYQRHYSEGLMTHDAAQILLNDFGKGEKREFLWLHYMDPHQPYDRREPHATDFSPDYTGEWDSSEETLQRIFVDKLELQEEDLEHIRAVYDSQVRLVDTYIRSILFALDESGVADDTLVVFTADHGEDLYDHNRYFYHANSIYRSATHIPLIFRQRGVIPGGVRVEGLCEIIDIMPTVLTHLGIDPYNDDAYSRPRGIDLGLAMEGADIGKGFAFAQLSDKAYSVRNKDWMYVSNPGNFMPKSIPEAGKYPVSTRELYDLRADPNEQVNVIEDHPEIADKMNRVLNAWLRGLGTARGRDRDVSQEELEELRRLGYVGDGE